MVINSETEVVSGTERVKVLQNQSSYLGPDKAVLTGKVFMLHSLFQTQVFGNLSLIFSM